MYRYDTAGYSQSLAPLSLSLLMSCICTHALHPQELCSARAAEAGGQRQGGFRVSLRIRSLEFPGRQYMNTKPLFGDDLGSKRRIPIRDDRRPSEERERERDGE